MTEKMKPLNNSEMRSCYYFSGKYDLRKLASSKPSISRYSFFEKHFLRIRKVSKKPIYIFF